LVFGRQLISTLLEMLQSLVKGCFFIIFVMVLLFTLLAAMLGQGL
jgi:hypothetical protein